MRMFHITFDRCHSKFFTHTGMQDLLQPCMQQILARKNKSLPFSLIVIVSRSTTIIIPNIGASNDRCYIKLVM